MEGKSSKPERSSPTHDDVPASSSGGAAACEAGKTLAASSSGGSPSPAAASSEKRPSSGDGAGELPGWKLDCLCRESGMSAAVISGGFPCF